MPPLPAPTLAEAQAYYDKGLYLTAWAKTRRFGPLSGWTGTDAVILAGRLAGNLGAGRLGTALLLRARRRDPGHGSALCFGLLALLETKGPLRAWEELSRVPENLDAPPAVRSDLLALRARIASIFCDHDCAERWLEEAEAISPSDPWLAVERARVLEAQDRHEDALAAAGRALEIRPWFRPAVHARAQLLKLLDRDEEALSLLTSASMSLESAPVVAELAQLQIDLGDFSGARRSWELFRELAPLLDEAGEKWWHARRADAAYLAGDRSAAAEAAQRAGAELPVGFAARLGDAAPARRVVLPVPFVKQHHETCLPSTMAALCRFHGLPTDHLAIAETICYDGTPTHDGREWAEANGYVARELTVTWDSATALLDRGLPFVVFTVEPTSGHAQAVVGYDACRRSLIIRDPSSRPLREVLAGPFLEAYAASGPAAMVFVPQQQASHLEGMDLPDARLYDLLYDLQLALKRHAREAAVAALERLAAAAPGHRLHRVAERTLATYDADPARVLAATEALLARYPGEALFELTRVAVLRQLARREDRLEILRRKATDAESDPIFCRSLAEELAVDARENAESRRFLLRSLRFRPVDAYALHLLGRIAWDTGDWHSARWLFRFASSTEEADEALAGHYFEASRPLGEEAIALAFLEGRFRRHGSRSSLPARTLFRALEQLDRTTEAFGRLEEALRLRPADGELLLFAAEAYSRAGDTSRAEAFLTEAEGRASGVDVLRARGGLAERRGERAESIAIQRELLRREPLALDAHRDLARLLAETEGRRAALAHLREAGREFPHHFALHRLQLEWTSDDDLRAAEVVLDRLVSIDPADAWTRRERALLYGKQHRLEEAFEEGKTAFALDPVNPVCFLIWGRLCVLAGALPQAMESFRSALRLSVDLSPAVSAWLDACRTTREKQDVLTFYVEQLSRQVTFGEGVLGLHELSQGLLEPDRLLVELRGLHGARPDLWQTWAALTAQLVETKRLDEAAAMARQAVARFPLRIELRSGLARVCEARGDKEGEVRALRAALALDPSNGPASRQLARWYDREGDAVAAEFTLAGALRRSPLDAVSHGYLAELLYRRGDLLGAVDSLRRALELEPGYEWAWHTLDRWGGEVRRPDLAQAMARDLAARRSGDPEAWLVYARLLVEPHQRDERLATIERAILLQPGLVEAHDLKARTLASLGRCDEAIAACRPAVFGANPPLTLRGREAWVLAFRGLLSEGIERMRALVAEDGSFLWGWDQLAAWASAQGDQTLLLEASEALVRLSPEDARSWGRRAHARLAADKRLLAKSDLAKAFDLDPTYSFAGESLFDLQFEERDWRGASATLKKLQASLPGPETLCRRVRLAAQAREQGVAREAFRALVAAPGDDRGPLDRAAEVMVEMGWREDVGRALEQALETGGQVIGAAWAEVACETLSCEEMEARLKSLRRRPEVAIEATCAYIEVLIHARQDERVREFLRREATYLQSETRMWGVVGRALSVLGDDRALLTWLEDWNERRGVEPWMLLSYSIALRNRGREKEASRVNQRASRLPEDRTSALHALWLSADEIMGEAGLERIEDRLRQLDPERLPPFHRFLYVCVEAVAVMKRRLSREHDEASRSGAVSFAEARLRRAAAEYPDYTGDPALLSVFKAALRQATARRSGARV